MRTHGEFAEVLRSIAASQTESGWMIEEDLIAIATAADEFERLVGVAEIVEAIGIDANVNWAEDNFGAGQRSAANEILDALRDETKAIR